MDIVRHPGEDLFFEAILSLRTVEDCRLFFEDVATIKELQDYDVVMWEKHGVFAVDVDVMAAFDQVDVLNKSALIYIAAKNMGFEPDGMSQLQMKEMSVAFNLPK